MVTCKIDSQTVAVSKMNTARTRKQPSSNSNLSERPLLDEDQLECASSISRNSIYKLKIDLMFDDSRSLCSSQLDDPRGSHRTRSIIMYGRSELANTTNASTHSIANFLEESKNTSRTLGEKTQKDVELISNSVQAQIEQLFTDVAKDATSSFNVTCLGSIPLKDKVTSLQGLQEPLRHLYLSQIHKKKLSLGTLDICSTGLRIKINFKNKMINESNFENEALITPFHNIAVWSAVKFVLSEEDGGAAFLPLITDPENIDKKLLFQPLSASEQRVIESNSHYPIFAVVMRSSDMPKVLECHGFICKSTEDAVVIAATLYQSLMSHVSINSQRSSKRRTPRNENGVSCISIASSTPLSNSTYIPRSQVVPKNNSRRSSLCNNNGGCLFGQQLTPRSTRKKRASKTSISSCNNITNEATETSTDDCKRKSHKTKRAPPVPIPKPESGHKGNRNEIICCNGHASICNQKPIPRTQNYHSHLKNSLDTNFTTSNIIRGDSQATIVAVTSNTSGEGNNIRNATNGDILTRVAIPRSGSFLNTGGLTRYKSRAAKRYSCKHDGSVGGGGGSPLGFSELFNEFRLHENLHSLDDILYAIIDADGMSFNDLKPIYKEFLLKLAVTLTQDELFQRSKNIMRRQRKKKQKRKSSQSGSQKKPKQNIFITNKIKNFFQFGQFRSCRGKLLTTKKEARPGEQKLAAVISPPFTNSIHQIKQQQQRSRVATSGSDISLVHQDSTFHGLNRNSSSGYVSCSECSYDSETCTCLSADRCYCSLRTEHLNNKWRHKNEKAFSKSKNSKTAYTSRNNNTNENRHSFVSCKSDDKCYCSMAEEELKNSVHNNSVSSPSDTTWCDSDSCVSASKCYCKHAHSLNDISKKTIQNRQSNSKVDKKVEKLGLDYELFTIGGRSKPMQPDEALSVKKSVEAAAIFADMKLSQTTDIKSLCTSTERSIINQIKSKLKSNNSCTSNSSTKKYSYKRRDSLNIDRSIEGNSVIAMTSSHVMKLSSSADNIVSQLAETDKVNCIPGPPTESISCAVGKIKSCNQILRKSPSLEDTLGYLP